MDEQCALVDERRRGRENDARDARCVGKGSRKVLAPYRIWLDQIFKLILYY